MSLRQRLAAVVKRLTGNVRLTPTGAPVIQTESGLQFNGYFVESLKCLDPGEYQFLSGRRLILIPGKIGMNRASPGPPLCSAWWTVAQGINRQNESTAQEEQERKAA